MYLMVVSCQVSACPNRYPILHFVTFSTAESADPSCVSARFVGRLNFAFLQVFKAYFTIEQVPELIRMIVDKLHSSHEILVP